MKTFIWMCLIPFCVCSYLFSTLLEEILLKPFHIFCCSLSLIISSKKICLFPQAAFFTFLIILGTQELVLWMTLAYLLSKIHSLQNFICFSQVFSFGIAHVFIVFLDVVFISFNEPTETISDFSRNFIFFIFTFFEIIHHRASRCFSKQLFYSETLLISPPVLSVAFLLSL